LLREGEQESGTGSDEKRKREERGEGNDAHRARRQTLEHASVEADAGDESDPAKPEP
jgi:hypothetical protein